MLIRPVQPTDRAEWLRMRLNLWGGAAEEHIQDIANYFTTPQGRVACLSPADIVSRPPSFRLRPMDQPVMSPPNRFATPRLALLTYI
jgi:hypothetical protein